MTNSTEKNIAKNVKKQRAKLKLTQENLAELCEVTVDYIYLIEAGKRIPSLKMAIKLARVLNVTVDYLLK